MAMEGYGATTAEAPRRDAGRSKLRTIGLGLVLCVAVVVGVLALVSPTPQSSELLSDDSHYYNDESMLRLRDDAYISMLTDEDLTDVAKDVAQEKVEQRIVADVHRMTYDIPDYDLDKVTKIAEEKLLYDHTEVSQIELEVAREISPTLTLHKLPQVAHLEHKLTNHIMSVLTAEATREIDAMVSGTGEPSHLQTMTKARLLRKTNLILEHEVRYRVARFLNARLQKNVHAGVQAVLAHLRKTVDGEQKAADKAEAGPAAQPAPRAAPQPAAPQPVEDVSPVKHQLASASLKKKGKGGAGKVSQQSSGSRAMASIWTAAAALIAVFAALA